MEVQENSHFGMSQGFAGDVALHLGLINGVDRHPHYAAANCDCPEGMSLERIWVKAVVEVNKQYHNVSEE